LGETANRYRYEQGQAELAAERFINIEYATECLLGRIIANDDHPNTQNLEYFQTIGSEPCNQSKDYIKSAIKVEGRPVSRNTKIANRS
jgi:hypothetical protein